MLCSVGCWICLVWRSFTWFGWFKIGGGFLFDFGGVLVCGFSMLVWLICVSAWCGYCFWVYWFNGVVYVCLGVTALLCLFEYANWFDLLVCLWDGLGCWCVGLYCDVVVGFLGVWWLISGCVCLF